MLATQITKDNIKEFVILFYTKILDDQQIGHFFIDILGDDINNNQWQEHIDILIDFWASMLLQDNNYTGSPFAPHAKMKLQKADFDHWQILLDETLNEIYEIHTSKPFKEIGQIMSKNFLAKLDSQTV